MTSYGHAAGDAVLIAAVERMHAVLRGDDRVGRLGGDEFLIVCPNVASEAAGYDLASRLRASIRSTVKVGGADIALRGSIGLAWTAERTSSDELIARADQAMYRSKPPRAPAHR
jgi:diguanylate cyclase (GGDEF)-like protein